MSHVASRSIVVVMLAGMIGACSGSNAAPDDATMPTAAAGSSGDASSAARGGSGSAGSGSAASGGSGTAASGGTSSGSDASTTTGSPGSDAGAQGGNGSAPPSAIVMECQATPAEERGELCLCIDYALRGEEPPDALRDSCARMLGRSCCEDDEVCLTGGGSGTPGVGQPANTPSCVPRPDGCQALSCDCFERDPCTAAGRGVCTAPAGRAPELSRELICQAP